jgi:iron uptake system component EfeO
MGWNGRRKIGTGVAALALTIGAGGLSSCSTRDASVLGGDPVAVTSGPAQCVLSVTRYLAGKVVFDVTNSGSEPSAFRIYANDGETVIGEVRDIPPGEAKQLTLTLMPGGFVSACEPNGKDGGIRGSFEVNGENLA